MASPFVLDGVSSLGTWVPISLKSSGFLSVTSVGGESLDAAATSSPKRFERLPAISLTRPASTVTEATGTPHSAAAASTSIALAAAPALRICMNELAMAVEPPVNWTGPKVWA